MKIRTKKGEDEAGLKCEIVTVIYDDGDTIKGFIYPPDLYPSSVYKGWHGEFRYKTFGEYEGHEYLGEHSTREEIINDLKERARKYFEMEL